MGFFLVGLVFSFFSFAEGAESKLPYSRENLTYSDSSGQKFQGLVVKPLGKGASERLPAILMIHNWMGVSDETEFQASRFAKEGYLVFLADIYGEGIRPKNREEAGALAGKYKGDRPLFRQRLTLALKELEKRSDVNSKRIFALGYCFGGTGVLELARNGADVKGVVSFHGGLDSPDPEAGKRIKAAVLVLHGADDPFVPAKDIAAFRKEMTVGKVKWKMEEYAGAVHSFTEKGAGNDNSKGAAYNEEADRESLKAALAFLKNTK